MKHIKWLILLLFMGGCFFTRVDWENDRKSVTVLTLFQERHITLDPNSLGYSSDSKGVKARYSPLGVGVEVE